MEIFIYCPSPVGHARELAGRLIGLAGCSIRWLSHPRDLEACCLTEVAKKDACCTLYLAEVKHTEALSLYLNQFTGRVIVQVPHALPHHRPGSRILALKKIYNRADHLLVPHDGVASRLYELGVNRDKVIRLHSYPYRAPASVRVPSRSDGQLLSLGYHHTSSGVDRLIELAKVVGEDSSMRIVVGGKLHSRDSVRLRMAGCKVMNRFLSDNEMIRLMRGSGCLLMPYRKSVGSPLVNQAMEEGLPVLRTWELHDWNGMDTVVGATLAWDAHEWCRMAKILAMDSYRMHARAAKLVRFGRSIVRKQIRDLLLMSTQPVPDLSQIIEVKNEPIIT